ncbi:BPL-N domain-containing protein [Rhodococcus sp. Q]|uniref:BPL-N domain-containing protein n=1 Tax=Rhodococcus sp. Q TaxID=2502252 RepID=UPI002016A45E|nr:BPL-N domain-containing protein [Rhodococcus sp. Q]
MHAHRRVLIVLTAVIALLGPLTAVTAHAAVPIAPEQPLALVYRGPASVPGTAESVATVLRNSPSKFRVEYVGPNDTPITAATLARATVFAQPGGPSLSTAWKAMRPYADLLEDWIAGGGNYLGFCVGGYLAGATPGYDLLPGDTYQYSAKRGATVWNEDPARSTVVWRGQEYTTYFQDPPGFDIEPDDSTTILATYEGGEIAALAVDHGKGRVGVTGPHIEADRSWFVDDDLSPDGAVNPHLAYDLIETTVQGNTSGRVPTPTASPVPAPAPVVPGLPVLPLPPAIPSASAMPVSGAAIQTPTTAQSTSPALPGLPALPAVPAAPAVPAPPAVPAAPAVTAPEPPELPWPFGLVADLPFVRHFVIRIGAGAPAPAS